MKRSTFIKGVAGMLGLAVLPLSVKAAKSKIYLLQDFVRGFRFYKGPELLKQIQTGEKLRLQREKENKQDALAIAVYYKNEKIGFVPKEKNEVLSALMDGGVAELHAEITHLELDAETWENVHFAIYLLGEESKEIPAYLKTVIQPEYASLIKTGDELYEALVENSSNNAVYGLIHNAFPKGEDMDKAVRDESIIISNRKIPEHLAPLNLLVNAAGKKTKVPGMFFSDYYIANINRIAKIPDAIKEFKVIEDGAGKGFYEVVFTEQIKNKSNRGR